jgi:hypothetical protein
MKIGVGVRNIVCIYRSGWVVRLMGMWDGVEL